MLETKLPTFALTCFFASSTVKSMGSSIYRIDSHSPEWPELLCELPEKARPKELFVRGALPPKDALVVSIVGTRKPTTYGRDMAEDIARTLTLRGIVIASGMALGIDTVAHQTAIATRTPTLAILGNGLSESVIYPKENLALSREIVESGGAIISEYKDDQKPELWTFPQRNRIIAGIAKAVVVIEAGEKSGALITARFATEYNREVFALPGQIKSAKSQGTNALIKQGAIPITSANDILEALGLAPETEKIERESASEEEQKILDALDEERGLDDIIRQTQLAPHVILAATTALELKGMIKSTSGLYRKA